jgi:hypothetical protein
VSSKIERKMGQIRRKQSFGVIGSGSDDEPISYCPECQKYRVLSILKDRIYLPDEPIPHDKEKEKWKQCHTCGLIVPIYETKIESKLHDAVFCSHCGSKIKITFRKYA